MTYEELQEVELHTPIEILDGKMIRGEITGKTHNDKGRALRVHILLEDGRIDDCIPTIVKLLCPLQRLAEIL